MNEKVLIAVLLSALACFGFGAPSDAPAVEERLVDRALYRAAAQYRLGERQHIYPALAVAVAAARRGATAGQIQSEVAKAQNALWGRDDDLDEATLAAAESLADADAHALGAVEAVVGAGDVHWTAAPRVRTADAVARARQQVLEHYDEAYHTYGALREWGIPGDVIGVLPDAPREAVVAVLPDALGREMLALASADDGTRIRAVRAKGNALWQELDELRNLSTPELGLDLRAYLDNAGALTRADEEDRDRATRVEGIQSLVYLGAKLVGIGDPEVGAKLETIGYTLIGLHESWSKFRGVSKGLKGLAAATLTADFVSAAIALVNLFVDTGPTTDELILENIAALGRQIEESRLQMHVRFDFVDKRLNEIHIDLAERLNALARHVLENRADTRRIATDIALHLKWQSDMLQNIYPTLVEGTAVLLERIDEASVGRCFYRQVMTASEFDSCLAQIRAIALDGGLARQQVPLPNSTLNFQAVVEKTPGAVTEAIGAAFAERLRGTCVPGVDPSVWVAVQRKHDGLVAEWPRHAPLARGDDGGYAAVMRRHRDCILQLAGAIAGDLVAYAESADRGAGTVVGSLIAEVRSRADDAQDAIREAAGDKRREWRRNDGLDWRDPADEWQRVSREHWTASLGHNGGYCEPEDWKDVNGRGGGRTSSLAYYIAPERVGGRTDDARWRERQRHLDEELRRRIRRSVPVAIQSMSALKMGHLRVCAIGRIRDHGVSLTDLPADGDRDNTAGYVAEVDAEVLVAVRWEGRCGKRFVLEADDTEHWRSRFRFTVQHRGDWRDPFVRVGWVRVPGGYSVRKVHRVAEPLPERILVHPSANRDNQRWAMRRAFHDAVAEVREEMRDWEGEADRACKQQYIERFARKRDGRLAVVGRTPAVQRAIADYDETAARANLLVSAWIRFAMRDATRRSDILTGIASHAIRLPLWRDARASAERPADHLLNQHERLEDLTRLYERAIGSDEVRRLAASGLAGYPGISRVVFDSLDTDHQAVVARRTAVEDPPARPGSAPVSAASGGP